MVTRACAFLMGLIVVARMDLAEADGPRPCIDGHRRSGTCCRSPGPGGRCRDRRHPPVEQ